MRTLRAKDQELLLRLSTQRDEAFAAAKDKSAPWLSGGAVFLLGLLAGVGGTLLLSRALR